MDGQSKTQPRSRPAEDNSDTHKSPQIPDGIGLDFEAIRSLLVEKHATHIGVDDPVLMLVTLNNAFLNEYDKLLARHNEALTTFLSEAGAQHLDSAKQSAEAVTKGLSASSIGVIQEHIQGHRKAMASFQNNMTWLAVIVAISATVNVAVFVYRGLL